MKKTIFILLAVAAMALIGYCCYCWWKDDGLPNYYDSDFLTKARLESIRRNREVPRLREELWLSNFRGPSERYVWKCPASVTVSNQTFKISNVKKIPRCEAYSLDVGSEVEGVLHRVCHCRIVVARYPEAALDCMLSDILAYDTAWPRRRLGVEVDEKGNVLVAEKTWSWWEMQVALSGGAPMGDGMGLVVDPTRFKRTYGNIYMEIDLERGVKDVPCAKDFALPLLEAGASRRLSIFGH